MAWQQPAKTSPIIYRQIHLHLSNGHIWSTGTAEMAFFDDVGLYLPDGPPMKECTTSDDDAQLLRNPPFLYRPVASPSICM